MNKYLLVTICFFIGILLFYMLKNHCDCNVIEGQRFDGVTIVLTIIDTFEGESSPSGLGNNLQMNIENGQIVINGVNREFYETMTTGAGLINVGINVIENTATIDINRFIDTLLEIANAVQQGETYQGIHTDENLVNTFINVLNTIVIPVTDVNQEEWNAAIIGGVPVRTYFPFLNTFIELNIGGINGRRRIAFEMVQSGFRQVITTLLENTNAVEIIQRAEEGEWEVYVEPTAAGGGDIVRLLRENRLQLGRTFNVQVVNNVTNAIFRIEGTIMEARFTYIGQRGNPVNTAGSRLNFALGSALLMTCQHLMERGGRKGGFRRL